MIKLDIDSDSGQSNQAFAKNDSTYHSENVNDHLNIIMITFIPHERK